MPLYEYKCGSCGVVFEVLQKFSDEPLTVHENCGGHVERLISPSAFHFKGSGWYVTDYARGSGAKAGKNGGAKTASKEDSSKPAEKAEKKKDTAASSTAPEKK